MRHVKPFSALLALCLTSTAAAQQRALDVNVTNTVLPVEQKGPVAISGTVPVSGSVAVSSLPSVTVGNASSDPVPVVVQKGAPYAGYLTLGLGGNDIKKTSVLIEPKATSLVKIEFAAARCMSKADIAPVHAEFRTMAWVDGPLAVQLAAIPFERVGRTADGDYISILRPTALSIFSHPGRWPLEVSVFMPAPAVGDLFCYFTVSGRYE